MAAFLALVVALPPAPGWELQEAFASALGLVPRVVVASILGYWAGEFTNSFVLARLKVATATAGTCGCEPSARRWSARPWTR